MEMLNSAINDEDFGVREYSSWTMKPRKAPWTTQRISHVERSYVYSILDEVFDWDDMTIKRIENPFLRARYILRLEEMKAEYKSRDVEEEVVVHATSLSNAFKIADENFNWRLASRCRYGRGVSFAADAEYANNQASDNDAFIITGILVANTEIGNYGTRIPSCNSDTTTNRQESVYVKYNDNEYYPYYIVY